LQKYSDKEIQDELLSGFEHCFWADSNPDQAGDPIFPEAVERF
jgi:hypothetical protein